MVIVIWVTGGLITLYLANKKEGARRNKSAFQSFCSDVADHPLPATLGYFFLFVFWWGAALRALISNLYLWICAPRARMIPLPANEKPNSNRSHT